MFQHIIVRIKCAVTGEVIMNGVQITGDIAILNRPNAAGNGTLLNLFSQQRHDFPIWLGLTHWFHRTGKDISKTVVALSTNIPSFIMASSRQDIVRPLCGGVHTHVNIHIQLFCLT